MGQPSEAQRNSTEMSLGTTGRHFAQGSDRSFFDSIQCSERYFSTPGSSNADEIGDELRHYPPGVFPNLSFPEISQMVASNHVAIPRTQNPTYQEDEPTANMNIHGYRSQHSYGWQSHGYVVEGREATTLHRARMNWLAHGQDSPSSSLVQFAHWENQDAGYEMPQYVNRETLEAARGPYKVVYSEVKDDEEDDYYDGDDEDYWGGGGGSGGGPNPFARRAYNHWPAPPGYPFQHIGTPLRRRRSSVWKRR